jgi:predicted amidophosphoribosyltransferase
MKQSKTIKISTYNCKVVFVVTALLKEESNKIFKKYKITDEQDEGENEGITISPDLEKYYLLIDIVYLTHNTIAHEIYHAVTRITKDRGIEDEEAQAWLCGYLSEEIYKFLDNKKIEAKHGRK